MEIILNTQYRNWFLSEKAYSIGYIFVGEELLIGKELCDYFFCKIKQNTLKESLKEVKGSFAAIFDDGEKYYLIVDKVRSYPLFYGGKGDDRFIVDSVEYLGKYINNCRMNDAASAEFLATGYLEGNITLYSHIQNVVAGSYVVVTDAVIDTIIYHGHIHSKMENRTDEEIKCQSGEILENAFKKLLRTIGNKQIIIPLSGGYDSRLIACLCKKFKIENVICFTYGKIDSPEVCVSKQVAYQLGFQWHYIEYTNAVIERWFNNGLYEKYAYYAGNYNTIPHFQDLFAVLELVERKIIDPSNAIFFPGHTGDVLGGSQMPGLKYLEKKNCQKLYIGTIVI